MNSTRSQNIAIERMRYAANLEKALKALVEASDKYLGLFVDKETDSRLTGLIQATVAEIREQLESEHLPPF